MRVFGLRAGLLLLVTALLVASSPAASRPQPAQASVAAPYPTTQFAPKMLAGSWIYQSGITLSDLDGNGTQEMIFGGRNLIGTNTLGCGGMVYAYNANGSLKWSATVRADVNSTAATADLNGDGVRDVVIGMGGWIVDGATGADVQYDCDGGLVALDGVNGALLWTFDTTDYGEWDAANGRLDGVYSSPSIGDLDGDGRWDIVFGGWDQCIYRLDASGNAVWTSLDTEGRCNNRGYWNRDTVWGSPALANLDGEPGLEIVIGADITLGGPEGYLLVLDADGTLLARKQFPQVFYSSPAIADLDRNGVQDIVIGSGISDRTPGVGHYVVFAHYDPAQPTLDGRIVVDWQPNTGGMVFASPAIGDLNADGYLDVVVQSFFGDTFPWWPMHAHGFDYKRRAALFNTPLCDGTLPGYAWKGLMFSSPVLADVAGDSRPEALFTMRRDIVILNPDGTYYTNTSDATCSGGQPSTTSYNLSTNGAVQGTPAVGDLDGDGDSEIVAAGYWNEDDPNELRGGLFAWSGFKNGSRPWPMFRRDIRHNARYVNAPRLGVSPASVLVLHQSGDSTDEQAYLVIDNLGEESFDWTASVPANVTLSQMAGTLIAPTVLAINTFPGSKNYAIGVHDLGVIQVQAVWEGNPVSDSPASIPVTLRVVSHLSKTFWPALFKSTATF